MILLSSCHKQKSPNKIYKIPFWFLTSNLLYQINIFSLLILSIILPLSSCTKEKKCFNGEITIFDLPQKVDTLKIDEHLVFDGFYTGDLYTYDSVIFFKSPMYITHYINAYSLNSKEQTGIFFLKGNGHNEVIQCVPASDIFLSGNEIKMWMLIENRELAIFNISKSLEHRTTILDTITIDIRMSHPKIFLFALDSSQYLIKTKIQEFYNNTHSDFIPGEYLLFKTNTDSIEKSYTLFNRGIINNEITKSKEIYYSSFDKLKPDKSMVAMAMSIMPQINILDLNTGELKGFKHKNISDYRYLKGRVSDFIFYYRSINVDNDYIYTAYVNSPYNKGMGATEQTHFIHIYDWEGNFIRQLYLEKAFFVFKVNTKTKKILTIDLNDNVYSYDLNLPV